MILITGAAGTVGSEVIAALLPALASRIRVLTRNPGAVFPGGTRNVGHDATDPITTLHRAGEEAIRDSGIGWTFLRPTAFMSNGLNWAPVIAAGQVVHAPFAAGRAAVVDPADIAAVAAACLTHDGHEHRVCELAGPEPLSPPDQVAILSQVLGRGLRYAEADPASALAEMVSYGMPEELAHAREMLDFLHTHHTGEDELLFPLLRERAALDPELMDRMDAQHAQVNDAVAAIRAQLPAWTASADAAAGERMAATIDATMPALTEHLAEEEQRLLPIVSVTLTQREWDALGKHGMSAIPVTRRLVILGHITEEADDAERQRFMQVIPAPARLAYKLIGHRQFTRETAAIRG